MTTTPPQWSADLSPADWLTTSTLPWHQLVTFGPEGFEQYARVRFIPDPSYDGQSEADVDRPDDAPSDLDLVRHAVRVLAPFTTTPDRCHLGQWDGYSSLPDEARNGPFLHLTHRDLALFTGSLDSLEAWDRVDHGPMPPALVWPGDRAWFLAADVDPHWFGVGASRQACRALLAEPGLDVVLADPAVRPPHYR